MFLSNAGNRDDFNMELAKYKQMALWNLEPPVCKRKPCPNLSKLSNGQLSCDGNLFEDSCTFECNEGFTMNGESSSTCTGFGRWSNR